MKNHFLYFANEFGICEMNFDPNGKESDNLHFFIYQNNLSMIVDCYGFDKKNLQFLMVDDKIQSF